MQQQAKSSPRNNNNILEELAYEDDQDGDQQSEVEFEEAEAQYGDGFVAQAGRRTITSKEKAAVGDPIKDEEEDSEELEMEMQDSVNLDLEGSKIIQTNCNKM